MEFNKTTRIRAAVKNQYTHDKKQVQTPVDFKQRSFNHKTTQTQQSIKSNFIV